MRVTVKAIGAKTLKGIDAQKYLDDLKRVIDVHAGRVKKDFGNTVATWSHRPSFPIINQDTPSSMVRYIGPSGQYKDQFNWVHEGVRARMIRPRRAKMLRFQRGYMAATTPGRIGSRPAKRFGPWVSSKGFRWPGIRPREFSAIIAKKRGPDFARDVQASIIKTAIGR